jgi:hypothetical protein
MKDRTEMSEYTQNLLGRLDEQFPNSEKPFGFLTPPSESFGTLEKIEEENIPVQDTTEEVPVAAPEPAGQESVADKEPDVPPTWFHTLNSSLEEARQHQERKANELQQELRELKTRPVAQPQPQQIPNYDPNALASMGDVAQIQNLTQRQIQELQQAQYQFAMRGEAERAKAAYERVKTRYPGVEKLYDQKQFDQIWSQWTGNDPRRSAATDWETELVTAYKARNHDQLETRINDLQKEMDSLRTKIAAPVTPVKAKEQVAAKKNLTLVPRPGSTRTVDSPTESTNPFFKKGGSFKNFGRELLRRSQGA